MDKPRPTPTPETLPYWLGAGAGELRYTFCRTCGVALFPPRANCGGCGEASEWRTSSGKGAVHAFTRVERAPTAAFRADAPYVVALLDLDEGFRIMANLRGEINGDLRIGSRVTIIFEPIAAETDWALPQARLA